MCWFALNGEMFFPSYSLHPSPRPAASHLGTITYKRDWVSIVKDKRDLFLGPIPGKVYPNK